MRLAAAVAATLLAGCASTKPPTVLVETRTIEVPISTPVPVSPSLTDQGTPPTLPEGPLTNEDLAQYIEALSAYTCHLRAKLADIAIAHGSGASQVNCEH